MYWPIRCLARTPVFVIEVDVSQIDVPPCARPVDAVKLPRTNTRPSEPAGVTGQATAKGHSGTGGGSAPKLAHLTRSEDQVAGIRARPGT
jgi:hypothetical protein